MANPSTTISFKDVRFGWTHDTVLLDIPELRVAQGERLFLRGASGSGKSTLLSLITGVLKPKSGRIELFGEDVTRFSAAKRDRIRAARMGVIFQMFNLLPFLSVTGNVTLAGQFSPARRARIDGDVNAEAERLLIRLGIDGAMLKRQVKDLSVGQQQRVAAARALLGAPDLVIADEPTSALDTQARDNFIALLVEEASRTGATLVFVSHDPGLAPHFDRALDIQEINHAATQRESV